MREVARGYVGARCRRSLLRGDVRVIDTATLRQVEIILPFGRNLPHSFNPTSVLVAPTGRVVWVSTTSVLAPTSGGSRDRVDVFEASTGAQLASVAVGRGPFFLAMSPDGKRVDVADKESCDVKQIDTATFKVVATVHLSIHDGCPYGIAAGAGDNVAYVVTGRDHTLEMGHAGDSFETIDFSKAAVSSVREVGVDPVTVATLHGNPLAFVVDADRPTVYAVNPANGHIVARWRLGAVTPSS